MGNLMNWSALRLPRPLESAGSAEKIREALAASTILLWQEGNLRVPLLHMSEPLSLIHISEPTRPY